MMPEISNRAAAKAQARKLRAELAARGREIGHAEALERVAQARGFRDWNAFSAWLARGDAPAWSPGDRVSGRYLSVAFTGVVVSATQTSPGWFRLEIAFDAALDVVAFDSFSNMRKRIRAVVGPKGHSAERRSDGVPHLQLDL